MQFFFLQNLAILSHFSLKVLCTPRLKSDVLGQNFVETHPSKSVEPTKTCPQVPNWAAHDCHVPCQLPSLKVWIILSKTTLKFFPLYSEFANFHESARASSMPQGMNSMIKNNIIQFLLYSEFAYFHEIAWSFIPI